ncbi:MAG: HAMP domain-containing protein [Nitrospirae bacterium]|nr:HAMP domain-containing protein [Nitrospirota bacterium]
MTIRELLRKKAHSLTGKLLFAIGSMMLFLGFIFAFSFIRQFPDVPLWKVLVYGGPFVFLTSFALCMILYNFVTKPLAYLVEGMKRLSSGDMDYRIDLKGRDEIGILARSFNSMSDELKEYKEKMENWTKSLEDEVQKKTSEIYKAQEHLINTEKLASLGRMAAGVAHEINSPLTGIVTFSHLMLKRTPSENTQDIEDLNVIIDQAERCSKIIKGLLGFSRKTSSEKSSINLNTLLENTLAMVRHQSRFYNIQFDLRLDSAIPEVIADPNQIQQVFLNLLINAADAMEKKGQITLASRRIENNGSSFVEIEVADSGPGIPEEIRGKVFEPFFTTKPVGKGTGLGLAVSYGIIKKHEGTIFVKDSPGSGASFCIHLPAQNTTV